DQALVCLRRAIALKADDAAAYNNLGQVLCLGRQVGAALDCFRKAVALAPDYMTAANNIVYYSHFDPGCDGMAIRREAEHWAQRFAEPITRDSPAPEQVLPFQGRRLRVGYVSPDFYEHPVGRFMQAVLANHDRGAFGVIGYSDRARPDAMTATLR